MDDVVPIDNAVDRGLGVFDGDRVSISSIEDIPIVAASLQVNRHVVQPALARQRDPKCGKDRWHPLAASQAGR